MNTTTAVEDLTDQFGIDPVLQFECADSGLVRAVIRTEQAEVEVYLYGAHVTGYRPAGHEPVLFVSRESQIEEGSPIRGGVPICFPWFAVKADDPQAPMHGLVRTCTWDFIGSEQNQHHVALELATNFEQLRLIYRINIGLQLTLSLRVQNHGSTEADFEEALHTYLAVGDIQKTTISGLEGVRFFRKVDGIEYIQNDPLIRFSDETDNIYLNTQNDCVLEDPTLGRRIRIEKQGSNNTVVWNPWADKSAQMVDYGNNEWPRMVCIETCNVGHDRIRLAPDQAHEMTARISVESL